jgi:hypothetical protein
VFAAIRARGAECAANADLERAAADVERENAVDTDHGQQKPHHRERENLHRVRPDAA